MSSSEDTSSPPSRGGERSGPIPTSSQTWDDLPHATSPVEEGTSPNDSSWVTLGQGLSTETLINLALVYSISFTIFSKKDFGDILSNLWQECISLAVLEKPAPVIEMENTPH